MVTTPNKPAAAAPAVIVAPPADTDPFTDAFKGLSALKDDASALAIDAVLQGQELAPTGPTGAAAPTDGPTGPTGAAAPTDDLAAAADEVVEAVVDATGPTGPTGTIAPTDGPTGPTGRASAGVDTETFNELIKTLKGAVTPPPEKDSPQPQQAPLTDEEAEAINTYVTEFPQAAVAQQIIARRQIEAAVNYVLAEVASVLQPIAQRLETVALKTHLGDLEQVVPDYVAVRQQVVDWVETQPDYLRAAYHSVIQQGTVDQVKDLIDRYRVATGTAMPAQVTPKPGAELPAATKKAVAALAQVSSKRSTTTSSTPTDFDGAWDAAAKLE